ncbi:MAG: FecR domain-containing protein [Stappiaceae bacterium]
MPVNFTVIRRSSAVALCALLLAAGTFSEANAESKVGVSAAVRGKVFVRSGGLDQRKAAVKQDILLQDKVLTKKQSALQILLLDESVFTVGENCEMIIDRFVYDPQKKSGEMSGRVIKGAFRFMSGKIGKSNPSAANITTPSATIGIRGTFFEGVVGPDAVRLARELGLDTSGADQNKAMLVVLRGPGRNTNTLSNTGIIDINTGAGSVTISDANYAVFVPGPGQPPVGPVRVTDAVLTYLNFYLRTIPTGPGVGGGEKTGSEQSGQEFFNVPDGDFGPISDEFQDQLFDDQFEEPVMNDDPDTPGCMYSSCE